MNLHEYIESRIYAYGTVAMTIAIEVLAKHELYEFAEAVKQVLSSHNQRHNFNSGTIYHVGSIIEQEIAMTMMGYKTINHNNIPGHSADFLKSLAMIYDIDALMNKHELIRECTEVFENPKELIIEP